MIDQMSIWVSIVFGITTFVTLIFFIWTIKNANLPNKKIFFIFLGLTIWLIFQAVLSLKNIYKSDLSIIPPKIMVFGILPAIFTIVLLFISPKGREFIDSLPLKNITYLNIVRVPVEMVLYWLFLNKAVPELMTFEGRNFDILAGISAPFIAFFGFTKQKIYLNLILIWNFISLGLLINIVVNAILSAPSPFQQFAFQQPNIAILNFPFIWLATFIVPIVFFGHLTSIRQLLKKK